MTPKNAVSKIFQTAVLELASRYPFARTLVNSGRLSLPCVYDNSPLNTPDEDEFAVEMRPGTACVDADIRVKNKSSWWLNLLGDKFVCLLSNIPEQSVRVLQEHCPQIRCYVIDGNGEAGTAIEDPNNTLRDRYQLAPGGVYLIRPDQHVAARWRTLDIKKVHDAWRRACGDYIEAA